MQWMWQMKLIGRLGFKLSFYWGTGLFIIVWLMVIAIDFSDIDINKKLSVLTSEQVSYLVGDGLIKGLVLLCGLFIPAFLLLRIRCPRCKYKIFVEFYNQNFGPNGFSKFVKLERCPNCGFDPLVD